MPDSNFTDSPNTNDSITPITFEESVRRRPGMYFGGVGGKGTALLIRALILECIEVCKSKNLLFTVSINTDSSFSIEIDGETNLIPFLQTFDSAIVTSDSLTYARTITPVSKRLEISNDKIQALFIEGQWQFNNCNNENTPQTHAIITCEIDETIFRETNIDYPYLNQELFLIPIVNRKTEILTRDKRTKYLNQNYYHFPQGSFYIFDTIINSLNGRPDLQLKYESSLDKYQYQIALADKSWGGSIMSFANYIHTTCNGSLVDGIIEGMIMAGKKYVKDKKFEHYKITKKKILEKFIIVCSVNGPDFEYEGSFKQKLSSKIVQSQSKELVSKWIYSHLQSDESVQRLFLSYFDECPYLRFNDSRRH